MLMRLGFIHLCFVVACQVIELKAASPEGLARR